MILQDPYILDKASRISALIQSNEKFKFNQKHSPRSPTNNTFSNNTFEVKPIELEPVEVLESELNIQQNQDIYVTNIKKVVRLKSMNMNQM